MAVYKGREVTVLGPSSGEDPSPMYDIRDKDGERTSVKLSHIQFTSDEVNKMKDKSISHLDNVHVIEDKHLQELRDGQDKSKIEAKQGKAPQYGDTHPAPVAPAGTVVAKDSKIPWVKK